MNFNFLWYTYFPLFKVKMTRSYPLNVSSEEVRKVINKSKSLCKGLIFLTLEEEFNFSSVATTLYNGGSHFGKKRKKFLLARQHSSGAQSSNLTSSFAKYMYIVVITLIKPEISRTTESDTHFCS